ncbi:MAG TPA: hypothetical protein VGR97_12975, partial [Candidatus Acidoferrales bacterium]|nr:hypothetical protein [Candidatus Acidoferrales bacterium]
MSKTRVNLALLGALCIAVCGVASPGFAGPDDGKSLVYLPAPASPASSTPCDRACLNGFVDRYFDALVSHCTCNVPFAPEVKYTENGELVKPGEGLWKTFTGRGTYRVYLADPATGEAGYYGDIDEFGILRGTMALRLKVKDRRIAEVEMIVAREQLRPKGGLGLNTAGIMTPKMIDELRPSGFVSPASALLEPVPAAERATQEQLIAITDRYFEAFAQSKSSVAPFADNCSRRENGIAATNSDGTVVDPAQPAFRVFSGSCAQEIDRGFFSALSKVGDRRPLVVDVKQGLVLDLAFLDDEGNVKSVSVSGVGDVKVPAEFLRPITYIEPQLFKIEAGKIREIEGLS